MARCGNSPTPASGARLSVGIDIDLPLPTERRDARATARPPAGPAGWCSWCRAFIPLASTKHTWLRSPGARRVGRGRRHAGRPRAVALRDRAGDHRRIEGGGAVAVQAGEPAGRGSATDASVCWGSVSAAVFRSWQPAVPRSETASPTCCRSEGTMTSRGFSDTCASGRKRGRHGNSSASPDADDGKNGRSRLRVARRLRCRRGSARRRRSGRAAAAGRRASRGGATVPGGVGARARRPAARRAGAIRGARTLAARLPEPSATLLRYVNDRDVVHLGARLLPYVRAYASDPALSPSKSPKPAAPLFLLHGTDDNVIPSLEAEYLADQVRGQTPVRLLLTSVISHAAVVHPPRAGEVMQACGFLGGLLGLADDHHEDTEDTSTQ